MSLPSAGNGNVAKPRNTLPAHTIDFRHVIDATTACRHGYALIVYRHCHYRHMLLLAARMRERAAAMMMAIWRYAKAGA